MHCVVPNCSNRTEKGVRLFMFPQGDNNEERRQQWIRNVDRTDLPQKPFLCEVHFENDQFENNRQDQRRLLKPDAVPTIFPHKSKMLAESDQNESNDDSESQGEIRRSSRKRKPIKFEDYDSGGDDKESAKENQDKIYMPELIRCRTCLGTEVKESAHIMKKMIYGKTIKQIILICTPELESSILDMECICQKCYRFLSKLMYFIESCRDSEEKLRSGEISLDKVSIDDPKLVRSIDSGEPTVKRKRGRPRKDEQRVVVASEKKVVVASETPTIKRKRGRPRKIKTEENEEDETSKVLGSDVPEDVKDVKKEVDLDATNISEEVVEEAVGIEETIEFIDQQTNKSEIIQIIFESDNEKSNEQQIEIGDNVILVETSNEDDKNVPKDLETIASDHSYLPKPIQKLLSCSYCQSDYRTLRGIKTHLIQVHGIQVNQDTECSLCKMKFIRYKDMMRHKVSHGHICIQCDKNFTTRAELEVHQSIHPEIFSCTQCGMKFKTEEVLKKHTPLHLMMSQICMQIQNTSVECPSCDLQFSTEQSLRMHTRLKHPTDSPAASFTCSECGQKYRRKEYLDAHIKTHRSRFSLFHNPNRKTYSKAFNTAEKTYKCQFCETKTNSIGTLIEHLSDHADLRKFQCKHCGLKSSSLRDLSMEFIHERKYGVYLITCSECCKKYKNEEELKKDDENSDTKQFSCNICNDSFTQLIQIECHVLSKHIQNLEEKANSVQTADNEHQMDIVNDTAIDLIKMEEQNSLKSEVKKKTGVNITKEAIENDWDSDPESPQPIEIAETIKEIPPNKEVEHKEERLKIEKDIKNDWDSDPESPPPIEIESAETIKEIPPNKEVEPKEEELKNEIDGFEESCVSIDLTEEESQECQKG